MGVGGRKEGSDRPLFASTLGRRIKKERGRKRRQRDAPLETGTLGRESRISSAILRSPEIIRAKRMSISTCIGKIKNFY